MQEHFDILIVGGGLIGVSLALALKNQSLRIGIIETKSTLGEASNKVLALSLSSQRIFATLNLWPLLAVNTNPIQEIHVSHEKHFSITRFRARDYQLSAFGYVIAAQELLRVMIETLSAENKIQLLLAAEILTLNYDNGINNITVKTANGIKQLSATLLLAADGANSTIRRLKNIAVKTHDYQQSAIVANVQLARDNNDIAYERFTQTGALALLPYKNNVSTLILTLSNKEVGDYLCLSEAAFIKKLQDRFGYRLGKFLAITERKTFNLQKITAETQIMPGLALVGNAAHTVHPVAAQGFNLGLRDVAALAQIIVEAKLQHKNIGAITELEKYQQWRQTDQKYTINFAHNILRVFSHQQLPMTLLRDLGLLGLDILPVTKKIFAQKAMGLSGQLPKLICGIPL